MKEIEQISFTIFFLNQQDINFIVDQQMLSLLHDHW